MSSESLTFPERWMPIPGSPGYEASDMGRLRSVDREVPHGLYGVAKCRGRLLGAHVNHDGYLRARVGRRIAFVHVLVLESFVGTRPDGMQACHNNGIPADARLSNLRWDSPTANVQDRKGHGTYQYGERNPNARITASCVAELREAALTTSTKELVRRFGLSSGHISNIINRRNWSPNA